MNPKIIRYAIEAHQSVNHLYNGAPYSVHLAMVVSYAYKFIDVIPDVDNHQQNVIDACWLHDTIEDCRLTYNDIKNVAGIEVAEIVYAVTNEKGKNRKERAGDAYYKGIKGTMWATFVKLCDRLANVEYSRFSDSGMFEMYKKEMPDFINKLSINGNIYGEMVEELHRLIS
jgi:(p)ppGpp synthase/HD superfamily hydrolase